MANYEFINCKYKYSIVRVVQKIIGIFKNAMLVDTMHIYIYMCVCVIIIKLMYI